MNITLFLLVLLYFILIKLSLKPRRFELIVYLAVERVSHSHSSVRKVTPQAEECRNPMRRRRRLLPQLRLRQQTRPRL